MRRGGVLLVRSAVTDMTLDNDQCRTVMGIKKRFVSASQHREIICIAHARDIPAVAQEPAADIFCKGEARCSLDRDVVIVVNPAQVRKLKVTC